MAVIIPGIDSRMAVVFGHISQFFCILFLKAKNGNTSQPKDFAKIQKKI